MRWNLGWPRSVNHLRQVAGLDISKAGCRLVILSGTHSEVVQVHCAEALHVPNGWISEGQLVDAANFGHWLGAYLMQGGYDVDALSIGVEEALISSHELGLAADLSNEDVAFQLSVDMQALLPETDVCMDYLLREAALDPVDPSRSALQTYIVKAIPRSLVNQALRMAQAAGLDLTVIEGRDDALRRLHTSDKFSNACRKALSLQDEVASGLALGVGQVSGFNFLPHRQRAQDALRRAWYLGMASCVLGGMLLSAGLAGALSVLVEQTASELGGGASIKRALDKATQAHQKAQSANQLAQEQQQWFQGRQAIHQHTLQWARVLNQSNPGLWLSTVSQQNQQWSAQGEALTSGHADALLAQLSQLAIWGRPPEMRQLQWVSSTAHHGLPVWQFRIEAELKGDQP